MIAAKRGVMYDITAGQEWIGYPAKRSRDVLARKRGVTEAEVRCALAGLSRGETECTLSIGHSQRAATRPRSARD